MTQTRLHFEAGRTDALRVYAAIEGEFEDDGLPLAMVETDETTALQEISVYTDDDAASVEERIRRLLAELSLDLPIGREELPDIDWVAKSLEGLAPVRAGRFLVYGSHARPNQEGGVIGIEIEAGMAFGTGHHATTCGCLEMIEAIGIRERPRNALDLGTGSAVLAIAIAKLLRIPVLATDLDPTATSVAAANIRKNGVSSLVRTRTASGLQDKVLSATAPFDLIVANILARPLMTMAPDMSRNLAPGGSVILSGILERQRNAVVAAYGTQKFRHVHTLRRQGWVTLHLKR